MTSVDDRVSTPPTTPDRFHVSRRLRSMLLVTAGFDVGVLAFSLLLAWQLRLALGFWPEASLGAAALAQLCGPAIVVLWLLLLFVQGAYSPRIFAEGPDEYRVVALASLITAGLVGLGCYLFQIPLSRAFVLLSFVVGLPLLLLERYLIRQTAYSLRRAGSLVHRVVAVGGPSGVVEVVDALRRDPYVAYDVVAATVPDGVTEEAARFPVPIRGSVNDIRGVCEEQGADTVLVARGGYATARELRQIAWQLEGSSISLIVVPSLTDIAGPRIQMRPVAGLPLLHVEQPQAGEAAGIGKRVFDIVGALVALLLLSPLMLAVTVLIKLEDRGPVLFRQLRVGRDGAPFACLKFRSMTVGAHSREAELRAAAGHEGALFKLADDPRVTRIGSFIRRFSLDELPQLLNVLRGTMSLVGPRPQQEWEVETYTAWEDRRLRVRPGMTGLWQVSGRSQLSFDEAIRLDLYYVDNWSMMVDLVIMARTVKAVLGRDGAY